MTQGTSPHGTGLSRPWVDAGQWATGWRPPAWQPSPRPAIALSAAVGLAAGLALTTGWHVVPAARLPVLLAVCAVGWLGLRASEPMPLLNEPASAAPDRLLAQMTHDLRTPLNAVIGFSEAMQRELHGPLGSARYQEYAAQR